MHLNHLSQELPEDTSLHSSSTLFSLTIKPSELMSTLILADKLDSNFGWWLLSCFQLIIDSWKIPQKETLYKTSSQRRTRDQNLTFSGLPADHLRARGLRDHMTDIFPPVWYLCHLTMQTKVQALPKHQRFVACCHLPVNQFSHLIT